MEDVTASLKNLDALMLLKKIIFNRRHYRLSILCLVLSCNAISLSLRKSINHLACCKPRDTHEISATWEELVFLDKETGEALQRYVFCQTLFGPRRMRRHECAQKNVIAFL
jgi:hypothetical protein